MNRLERKSDHIKVLEEGLTDRPIQRLQCHNCKERHYLVVRKTDTNNLFCTVCGALTPLRSVRRSRGLAAPAIQTEATAIAQPKNAATGKDRRPKPLKKPNPLEEQLTAKGFQIIDSQYEEPTPQG